MADAMLDKFNKYLENTNRVMVIATILDPRFKMRCHHEVVAINNELEKLYKKYEAMYRNKIGFYLNALARKPNELSRASSLT
ncbi:hypothetical protein E2562_028847 [Oryza meyeriana var. granulata]|uniref:hAT-like transposase RNase-H fold domain-containing protein n=1 Tax=Oryza meyeriana var. granulata TaxID=110450 RepID=A0A6G1FDG6_9ORYZ|nr:hypothetical protein E2562_028847 [Oryza meyeriana var. granulata]